MPFDAEMLERYLHQQIPLSAAMGARVRLASPEQVQLAAALAPNVNHHDTVFGGSAAALATLAAWSPLHLRIAGAGLQARLVIQRSSMEYHQPIPGDFDAVCRFSDELAWQRFRVTLARRGRARLTLTTHLIYDAQRMATFAGDFVALAQITGSELPQ
ncbi:MAG TPA: YiiD C-terminal domain-containing protein [Steroidobacteraceae bacterium]|jgi:thioesterase domain-containing protein|nr:YiiD C-terminal domain-containing protein [Steroidobacteraceae bacterium]